MKIRDENILSYVKSPINLYENICAHKTDVEQQEIKEVVVLYYNVLQDVPWKLEIKCKVGVYFLVNFGCFHLAWYWASRTRSREITYLAKSAQCDKSFLSTIS